MKNLAIEKAQKDKKELAHQYNVSFFICRLVW